jgi:hypothetical protein
MKKLAWMALLGMAVLSTAVVGTRVSAEPEAQQLDPALVDAKIDARLHELLRELVASRAQP